MASFWKSLYLLYLVLLLGTEKQYIPVWEFILFSGVVVSSEKATYLYGYLLYLVV